MVKERLPFGTAERAGKDEVALHWTMYALWQKPATYWHMLPEASQARKAIWDSINPHTGIRRIDEVFPKELRSKTLENEMMIKFHNGSTWQVVGSDNYNSLVGSPPAGVVFSEYSLSNPLAWGYIRPIMLENDGWALFIYTSRGQNHGADLFDTADKSDEWFAQKLTVDDTNVFNESQLERERTEYIALYGDTAGMGLFRQEFYCSFDAAVLGSVYGEWIEQAQNDGRIRTSGVYMADKPVYCAWDLGFHDATVIVFYQIDDDGSIRFIDCFDGSGENIDYYCDILKKKQATEGYNYFKYQFVPHDAEIKTLQGRGRSIAQQAYEQGVNMRIIGAESQPNQIAAARKILRTAIFDANKCEKLLKALKNYQFRYDSERRMFSKEPIHDWSSHFADAVEVCGQVMIKNVHSDEKIEPKFLHNSTANDMFWPNNDENHSNYDRI